MIILFGIVIVLTIAFIAKTLYLIFKLKQLWPYEYPICTVEHVTMNLPITICIVNKVYNKEMFNPLHREKVIQSMDHAAVTEIGKHLLKGGFIKIEEVDDYSPESYFGQFTTRSYETRVVPCRK